MAFNFFKKKEIIKDENTEKYNNDIIEDIGKYILNEQVDNNDLNLTSFNSNFDEHIDEQSSPIPSLHQINNRSNWESSDNYFTPPLTNNMDLNADNNTFDVMQNNDNFVVNNASNIQNNNSIFANTPFLNNGEIDLNNKNLDINQQIINMNYNQNSDSNQNIIENHRFINNPINDSDILDNKLNGSIINEQNTQLHSSLNANQSNNILDINNYNYNPIMNNIESIPNNIKNSQDINVALSNLYKNTSDSNNENVINVNSDIQTSTQLKPSIFSEPVDEEVTVEEEIDPGYKRCPKCGQKMREDYKQCFVCGTMF